MNIASDARLEREVRPVPPARPAPRPAARVSKDLPEQWQRSAYEQPRSCRTLGGGGAVAVFASTLLLLFWAARVHDIPVVSAASDAIVVTLAPSPAAPPAPPVEVAPGPSRHEQQPADRQAKPSDSNTQERQPAEEEAPPLAGPTPAAPAGSPPPGAPAAKAVQVDRTTAPPSESRPATAAAAPVTSASASASALANWQGELLGHLKQFRRYPRQAESAGQKGVALVSITVDRAGKVLGVKLVRGSGYPTLDMEAQATVRRASPVPPPTADIPGDPVTAQIPIEFAISQ